MRQTSKPSVFFLLLLPLLYALPAFTQVVPGIRANGQVVNHGDTVRICEGNNLIYQSSAQGSMNISWQFTGGSITTATGLGPFIVNYPTAGFYTTNQLITGGNMADSMFIVVHVSNSRPTAGFNFTPNNVCGNINIQFTNNSSGAGLSYYWNFGDGSTSTLANPTHQFLQAIGMPGTITYPVKLVVTNLFGCKDSITQTVTVNKVPDAEVGNADLSITYGTFNGIPTFKRCSNIPSYIFSFINQSTTTAINSSYTISWGDGTPDTTFTTWSTGSIIKHLFPLGSSTMTVSVTGADGCVGIKKYIVFLGSTPAGGLASLGNTDVCASDSLRFAINNISANPPGTLYTFLINDGSAAQVFQHPPPSIAAHFFSQGSCSFASSSGNNIFNNAFGAYLTIENPCGTTSPSVVPIYVSGKPRASIHVSPSETVCTNTNVAIISTSAYGSVITPTGGTGSTCTNSGKQVWTISPATGYTITSGITGSLNGSSSNGLLWTNGSNFLNVNFNTTGTYTVKLYVFNDKCGLDSTVKVICVRNAPDAQFTMSSKSSCGAGSAVFTNASPSNGCQGDKYTWKVTYSDPLGCSTGQPPAWQFINGSTLNTPSPEIQFNVPGRYVIQLTVTAIDAGLACPESFKEDTFYVKGLPKAAINPINAVCISNGLTPSATASTCYSPGPVGYQWTFTNGTPASSNLLNPGTIQYASIGTHAVQLKVIDSSCNTSAIVNTTVTITDKPVANAGNDTAICGRTTIAIGSPGVNGVTYQWSPATGLSNAASANPLLTLDYTGAAADTTYGFKLTASIGANCASEDSIYITIKRRPVVTITTTAATICIGNSTRLEAGGATVYTWWPTASLSSIATDTMLATPTATTRYYVAGSLANGCADTANVPIIVNPDAKAQFTATGTTKCAPVNLDSVIKTIPFPQGNSLYTWYANGAQIGSNTTGAFPSYPISGQAQTVVIKLVTASTYGCKADSMNMTFHTVPGVTAGFTKNQAKGCGPLTVTFTNTSSQLNGIQFFWSFGNGTTSNVTSPSPVTFNNNPAFRDTTYYITLKAFNGCDTSYHRDSVLVYADAKARFTVDTTKGCSPFDVTITNKSAGNNFAYYWDFGDGFKDTTTSNNTFVHIYRTGVISTFDLRLIAENQCRRDTQTISLLVLPNNIDAQVSVNGNQLEGCAPHTTIFNNSSTGASQLTWNFGDGSPLAKTPNVQNTVSHTYTNGGIYTVTIKLENECTDTVIYRQVTVHNKPIAGFNLKNDIICAGNNVFTTSTAQNATGYDWLWGDGQTSPSSTNTHTYAAASTYTIRQVAKKLNNSGMVCTDTASRVLVVNNKIPPQISIRPGKACIPYTMQTTATGAANAKRIEWTFYDSAQTPNTFKGTGTSAAHIYNKPGTYWVKLVVHTTDECADSTTYSFEVHNTPVVQYTPANNSTCNHDTTISFKANIRYTGTDEVHLKWFINNDLEGMDSPFNYRFLAPVQSTTPAVFTIRVLAENEAGCGDTTAGGTLVIQPLPNPAIALSPSSILQQPDYTFTFWDEMPTNPNKIYTWDMGDRTRQQRSGQKITYQYADTGLYKVQVLVQDYGTGCSGYDTVQVRILYIPGYLYVPSAICPGCSNHSLRQFLPMGKGLSHYRLRIFNSWGQKVFETSRLDNNGSPSEPWDGRYNGQPLQQDSYGWQIEARYINGTEWKGMQYPGSDKPVKAGFITIVK
ncbi:PKD domain-containing protein [Niastella caeni]|uniref:PKD domain-containing protein n=1 Tax=Niastella caeni TaxID=2569763 RepID=A0A4S8HZL7_9BACT|nr:PKD domain-containing protein [Niastella caeni]THU40841.1 PKD domain-containing protein [Niastella caeni]